MVTRYSHALLVVILSVAAVTPVDSQEQKQNQAAKPAR